MDKYLKEIERYKWVIKGLRNGETALKLIDHLISIGQRAAPTHATASNLPALLRLIDFVENATRTDVECVVAKINQHPKWKELTKTVKMALRKLI